MNKIDKPIRLMLVDDHEVLRSGLIYIIDVIDSIEVVGQASNGVEAIELYEEVKTARIAGGLLRPYKGLLLAAPQGAAFTSFKPDATIT